jgi:hypothetical protein
VPNQPNSIVTRQAVPIAIMPLPHGALPLIQVAAPTMKNPSATEPSAGQRVPCGT